MRRRRGHDRAARFARPAVPEPGKGARRRGRRPVQEVPRLLLTRQEAAAALGMSVDTFERRVQPFIKLVPCGQLVLVPPRELERWIASNVRYLVDGVA
jgi:hypothetical protein